MRGGACGLNTPLNAGLKEGKAMGRRDLAGRCGRRRSRATTGGWGWDRHAVPGWQQLKEWRKGRAGPRAG
jgi:hypothetical protein